MLNTEPQPLSPTPVPEAEVLVHLSDAAAGKLREMLASDALEELLRTVGAGAIRLAQDERVLMPAFALATLLRHRVPDCMYLALAEQESAGLATADHALAALAQQRGIGTMLIGSPGL